MTREEAISELEFILVGHPKTSARGQAVLMAIAALKQPEQKKGKWIKYNDDIWECSNCGAYVTDVDNDIWPQYYCRSCGAKMEKEKRK